MSVGGFAAHETAAIVVGHYCEHWDNVTRTAYSPLSVGGASLDAFLAAGNAAAGDAAAATGNSTANGTSTRNTGLAAQLQPFSGCFYDRGFETFVSAGLAALNSAHARACDALTDGAGPTDTDAPFGGAPLCNVTVPCSDAPDRACYVLRCPVAPYCNRSYVGEAPASGANWTNGVIPGCAAAPHNASWDCGALPPSHLLRWFGLLR